MNVEKIVKAVQLRESGLNIEQISKEIDLSIATVSRILKEGYIPEIVICPECGKKLVNKKGIKPKKFCSEKCRLSWWGKHRELIKHRSFGLKNCPHCGKLFKPRSNQTYCSRICYLSEVTKR